MIGKSISYRVTMTEVRIHGIYAVDAPYPCHLVELSIFDGTEECEQLNGIVYPVMINGRKTKQAPFCEHFLSNDKGEILGDFLYGWDHPEIWTSEVRVAFLMHYLQPGGTLETPYGGVKIPDATLMPKRLSSIKYESPY
ncbi:MAG: hypothetical protein J0M26_18355 [Planctomycetes bacterium]|nr:hypothetical protein [Planctomycetota bacterium]